MGSCGCRRLTSGNPLERKEGNTGIVKRRRGWMGYKGAGILVRMQCWPFTEVNVE